jgi:MoxR-like ATPase
MSEELEAWELPNLQLALTAALERPGWSAEVLGIAGEGKRYSMLGLADLLTGAWQLGAPEYVNAEIGPGRTLPCLDYGLVLVTAPDGPFCLFVRRGDMMGQSSLVVQALAADEGRAQAALAELRALMRVHDVFRGQLITIQAGAHGGRRLVFLERPEMAREDLVLPAGLLEQVELHVLGPTRHRDALLASGRHLSRGLLLWGPPGTGKTHTVRYLTARLRDATVIVLSGAALGMVGAFGALARRLAPAVVVLEDVDLVAQEREFGPFGSSPALFELMNEMSGLGEDADVAFVLTTNRPDALEPALAARPGRIDLALEIPLPDAAARRRLLELYARGMTLDGVDLDALVARTEGVTAAFVKELLRKAVLAAAEEGRAAVSDADLSRALDALLSDTAAITRALLVGRSSGASGAGAPSPNAWLELPDPGQDVESGS